MPDQITIDNHAADNRAANNRAADNHTALAGRSSQRTKAIADWKRFIVPFAVLGAVIVCPMLTSVVDAQPPGAGPSRVVVTNVIRTTRAGSHSFVGTLEANRKTTLGSAVDGRVMEVLFNAGDPVGGTFDEQTREFVGEPLVEILKSTLDIEIRAAEIQVELSSQALEELKLALPQNLELARAALAEAESNLEYTRTKYERSRSLQQQSGAISQLELDEARSQYQANRQAAIGARIEVERLSSTSDLQIAQAQSRLSSTRQEHLRLRDLRDKYSIQAPFDGVVTRKMTEVGAWVTRGDPVAEIVQLDPIEMIVNIPQEFSGRLQESIQIAAEDEKLLSAVIEINGIETSIAGEVVRIVPQADLRSRSFPVRIRIANPKAGDNFLLQPGMLGRAVLSIGRESEMVLVKKDSLVIGPRETIIFKIANEGEKKIAVPVVVATGTEVGDWIQVSGDVNENDLVVVLGNERLRPRTEVSISETRTETLNE